MNVRRDSAIAVAAAVAIGMLGVSATAVGSTDETAATTTLRLSLAQPTTSRPSSQPTTTTPPTPTIPQVVVQPTTTRPAEPTTTSTIPAVIVQPTTTSTPDTTSSGPEPAPPVTTADASARPTLDLFVERIAVTQAGRDAGRLPLVAGRSSTWVRVATGHSGGADAIDVDGALLVEPDGRSGKVLLASNGPVNVGPGGTVFEFRIDPRHTSAGDVRLTFTLFRSDGTPVDDSPGNNSMTTVARFHAGRTPTLFLFVPLDLDANLLSEIAGDLGGTMLATLPTASVDVRTIPIPLVGSGDPGEPSTRRELIPQLVWSFDQLARPGDRAVIIGRVDDPAAGGEGTFVADSFSFGVESTPYEFPGRSAQRLDDVADCVALDSLGVPCDPADLGSVADPPSASCETQPIEWAGLELDLCVEPSGDSSALEEVPLTYQRIELEAPASGWLVVSGDWDRDGPNRGSIGMTRRTGELPAATAARLGAAVEGAVNGTAPADVALRFVGADGTPLAMVPANTRYTTVELTRAFAESWSTSGDTGDRPNEEPPDASGAAGFLTAIPWIDGAVALELVSLADGAVLDSLTIDAATSQVGGDETETVGGNRTITVGADQSVTVHWELDLSARAGATFDVLWRADGETWTPVAVGVTGNELILKDTSLLARSTGGEAQVAVVPGGVLHTDDWVQPASDLFHLPPTRPLVAIAGAPRGPVEQFEPVDVRAVVGVVPGGGDAGQFELAWSVSTGTFDASFDGRLLTARDLQPGEQVIELAVTDLATGTVSTARAVIEVVARTTPTRHGETPPPEVVELLTSSPAGITG